VGGGESPPGDYSDEAGMVSFSPMPGSSVLRVGAFCLAAACLVEASCRQTAAPVAEQQAPKTPAVVTRALAVGDPAPDFTLPGTDGNQYTLTSYRGRQTVVLAWFAKAFTEG
jgi:hypothetical protein